MSLIADASPCILVVGDVMLDEYVSGTWSRPNAGEKLRTIDVSQAAVRLGGAGNVAARIVELGGRAVLLGSTGGDADALMLADVAKAGGVEYVDIADASRRTTKKTRILVDAKPLIRIDYETRSRISTKHERQLLKQAARYIRDVAAIIVSDYAKGVVTDNVARSLILKAAELGKPVVVDPKGADWTKYSGATLITPNFEELSIAAGSEVRSKAATDRAVTTLLEKTGVMGILVTESECGMSLYESGRGRHRFPARKRRVANIVGAGDVVAASCAFGLACGCTLFKAVELSADLVASYVTTPRMGRMQRNAVRAFRRRAMGAR